MSNNIFILSYTADQINLINEHLSDSYRFITSLSFSTGASPDELLTIRPPGYRTPDSSVDWLPCRFAGRDGIRYTVAGDGGIIREILVPARLHRDLRQWRIADSDGVSIYDHCCSEWDSVFDRVSRTVLGWSHGYRGLRDGYCQLRLRELQNKGFAYFLSLAIISQELGFIKSISDY